MTASLTYPYGKPLLKGRLKVIAEDFLVDEMLGFEPAGEGEHLFVQVEKSNLTTHELIERVAKDAGIRPRDVGYSGIKDKTAVTRQWLSLHLPGKIHNAVSLEADDYIVLRQIWHDKKLRPGTHRSNRFDVLLREVVEPDSKSMEQIESISDFGMANYFGQQRFGAGLDNVQRALQVLGNARKSRRLGRNKKSLYLSALRSELFNQILSRRIEQGIWRQPVEGDIFMLSGSRSIFQEAINDEILARYRNFDISSTASLYGYGASRLSGTALQIEQRVYTENQDICDCLAAQGAKRQMRALRHVVQDFSVDYEADKQQLRVKATLPRGCYFTSLLGHFIETDAFN